MQVAIQQEGVLHMKPLQRSSRKQFKRVVGRNVALAEPDRDHLGSPAEFHRVEAKKSSHELRQRELAMPLWVLQIFWGVVLGVLLRGQDFQANSRIYLHVVDDHQREGVWGQVSVDCAAHARGAGPKFDQDPKHLHVLAHLSVRLQEVGVVQWLQVVAGEVNVQGLFESQFYDGNSGAPNFLDDLEPLVFLEDWQQLCPHVRCSELFFSFAETSCI
mmetsp:Transcript_22453/g.49208  ORF Transcript_22453/g.49208 Transcript_22453/m.49208 type:complete len:216 (-) Transcript_22453:724-1371(-)